MRCGSATRGPRGGAPCLCAGRPGTGALPTPTARLLGRAAGVHYPLTVGAGAVVVGTCHQPPACALASWLCALSGQYEGAQGGCLLPGRGASGVGRSPTPDRPSSKRAAGPTTHWLWVWGLRAWGHVTNPTARALASWHCALWKRHESARGGRLLPGCGASGVGRSATPGCPSFGACGRGPLPTGCGCGGCGPGDPTRTPQRALLRAGFARCGGGTRAPRGGALLACVWGVRRRALPHPRPLVLWGVRLGPLPTGCGCGGCGPGDASPTPQRALLQAGFVRCGSGTRAPGGGRLLAVCGASGHGRSPTPDHSSFGACGRGPPPTCCGCGRCGPWDPSPTAQRALLRAGFVRCGGGMRGPGGGACCLGAGRPGSGARPPPTALPLGRAAGADYPLAVVAGAAGVGTGHQSHSARSCELALRAVGASQERPCWAPLAWAWDVRGRALSHPERLVLWGVRKGPTTHWLWLRRVRAFGPVTNPTARALASWLCVLWGRHKGARGWGRLLPGCGASGVGRSPTPDRSSFRAFCRGPLPTGCGCGGSWARGPVTNP